jgi:hypothetical protein
MFLQGSDVLVLLAARSLSPGNIRPPQARMTFAGRFARVETRVGPIDTSVGLGQLYRLS